jgi:hypothetical protein
MRTLVLALAVGLGACAGGPRAYTPVASPPPTDQATFAAAMDACLAQSGEGRTAEAVVGGAVTAAGSAATTYTVGGVAFAAGAGATGTLAGASAAAGPAMVVALPVSLYFFSRADRARKERRIQTAMNACMEGRGFHIVEWRLAKP